MKKTKVGLIAALFLTLGLAAFAACTPEDTPSANEIELDHATWELDLHEQIQLTVSGAGDAAVTWESSDEAVATVDGGLVRSVSAGVAVITATAGEAKAECTVTVVNSMTAPVLEVSNKSVSVDKDAEFTLEAAVTYKGNAPIDPVSYTWELAEGSEEFLSLTPAQDGASAVIKGLEYGEASVTVSSVLWDIPMVETVAVKVCDTSISFEVEGYTPVKGGYKTTLGLVETDEYEVSTTPAIQVYQDGEPSDLEITWTSDNDGVVAVSGGTITALKEGSATLTGSCGNNFVRLFVEVVRPEVTIDPVIVETSVGTLKIALEGTIKNVSLDGGENLFGGYDAETETLTFNKDALPVSAAEMGDGRTLAIETEKAVYKAPAAVYTLVINDAKELAGWGEIAKQAANGPNWDGYFVLGNDIDFAGGTYVPFSTYSRFVELNGGSDVNCFNGRLYGFRGVFDGMGHIIDDIRMQCADAGGFVGLLHQNGVIRNVAFTNAVHLGNGGFVVSAGDGRVENVYVSCLTQQGGAGVNKSGFFFGRDCMGEARVVHCFVEIREVASGAREAYSIGGTHAGYGILNGVYTVGNPNAIYTISTGSGTPDVYGAYSDYDSMRAADIDFSAWDSDFWKIVNGIPFPKNMEVPEVSVIADITPVQNGTVDLEKEGDYQYGDTVVVTVEPVQGYKLRSLTVNGADLTSSVADGRVVVGYAYGDVTLQIQAVFAPDLDAYDVTFKADAKWGADGLVITMKQGDQTKTVTLGENAVVQGMNVGKWTATAEIGGMTVSLGEFDIQWPEYTVDFGSIFGGNGAVIGADLTDGSFTYGTGNLNSVAMNVELAPGDAVFALTLRLDKETVAAGKDWNCIGLSFVIGGELFQASMLYSSNPNAGGDYQNAYVYWANNDINDWTATTYFTTAFSQALTNGEEAILAFVYRAETGALEVYSGTSSENMTIAGINGHEGNDLALGTLPKNAQVTQVALIDTWGGVKSNIAVKLSYGATLEEALGAESQP